MRLAFLRGSLAQCDDASNRFACRTATAALTFAYGTIAVLLAHFLAERLRANPVVSRISKRWPDFR